MTTQSNMEGVCRRIISIGSDFLFNPFKVHDIRKRVRWFDKSVYIIKPIHLKFLKRKKKCMNKISYPQAYLHMTSSPGNRKILVQSSHTRTTFLQISRLPMTPRQEPSMKLAEALSKKMLAPTTAITNANHILCKEKEKGLKMTAERKSVNGHKSIREPISTYIHFS